MNRMELSAVMDHSRRLVLILLTALVAAMPVSRASAQGGTASYTSIFTGATVQTTGGWAIDMESTGVDGGAEIVSAMGPDNGVLLAWLPAGTDIVSGRDFMLGELSSLFDTVVSIDKGAYGSVSYSLDIGNAQGFEFGIFSLFLGERPSGYVEYYLYLGPVWSFADGFASSQRNITVGGQAIFNDIDGHGLQAFLTEHAGAAGGTITDPGESTGAGERPETTEVPIPAGTEPGEGSVYIAALRDEIDYLQTTLDDFIVNFAELQGDEVDHAIDEINRISGEWLVYPDRAAVIVAPVGYEKIDAEFRRTADDVLALGESWRNAVTALQTDSGFETALETFTETMNRVQQGLGTLTTLLDEVEGVDSTSGVATEVVPEPTATTTRVDGDPKTKRPDTTRPRNETETGAGGATSDPDTGTRDTGTRDTAGGYVDLGLIAEGEYVSPQQGVEIAWNDTWVFDESYDSPIESDIEAGVDKIVISWTDDTRVSVFVTIGASRGVQPADLVDIWASEDFLDTASQEAERLLVKTSRSGAAALLTREVLSEGTEVVVLRSAVCGDPACETLASTTMIGVPDLFAGAYRDARSGVMIQGQRLFDVFTPREVFDALGGGR